MSETFQYARRRKHVKVHNPFGCTYELIDGVYTPDIEMRLGCWIQVKDNPDSPFYKIVGKHQNPDADSWIKMSIGSSRYHNHTIGLAPTWIVVNPPEQVREEIEQSIALRIEDIKRAVGRYNYIWI